MVKMCSTQNFAVFSTKSQSYFKGRYAHTACCMSVLAFARALNPHSSIAFTVSSMVVRLFGRNQPTIRILLYFVNNKVFQLKLIKNANTYITHNNAKAVILKKQFL